MRRILIAIAMTVSATAAAKPRRPPRPTCEKSSAGFSQRQAEWATFTQKAFTDALAREQLTTPKVILRQLQPQDALLKGVKPGATVTIGKGADATVAVYVRTVQTYGAIRDEFVQDAQGVVHPLVRKENLVGNEAHTLCGCGPMGGGAVPPTMAIVYLLPAGASYDATPIELAYDAKRIEIRWRNVVDGADVMCMPPP